MYINLLHLSLFNFAYLFFLSFPFLSTYCFSLHLAPCFSFVFQFVLKLVLFLTVQHNFSFPLFARSIYCTLFLLDCFHCSWVYMYISIFHCFNYYLPDFVTAVCLVFIFGFSFLGIWFNLTQCHSKPLVESLFLTRNQALSLEWEQWLQDPRLPES